MDWYTSTDSDLALLEDATLGDYTDGLPDSYDIAQWYGAQDYPLSTLDDAEMALVVDGNPPIFVPFHVEWVGLDVAGGPVDNGWTVTNWTVHVL